MIKNLLYAILSTLVAATSAFAADPSADVVPNIIPWPKKVEPKPGQLALAPARIVAKVPALLPLARILSEEIAATTTLKLAAVSGPAKAGDIVLTLDATLEDEAYRLSVDAQAIASGGTYGAVAMASVSLL